MAHMAFKKENERDLLIRSEKMAVVSRLTAGMAHQILNPVNIMSMRFQLLKQRDDLPEDTKKVLAGCESQLDRITEIMNNLRPFSQAHKNHMSPCNLNATIAHVLKPMAPLLKEKGIDTDAQLQPDLPRIPLDKKRMAKVFWNLISNAADAMAEQKRRVLGITTRCHSADDFLQVVVSDTGSGIDEADLVKIFDPYFTTKKSGEHVGLGLFVSHNIVNEHGGTLWAERNDAGGSSFFVELPTAERAAKENS
jgi:signal transduction histidine kinase